MSDLTNPLTILEVTADQLESGQIILDEAVRVLRIVLPQAIDDYVQRVTEQTLSNALRAVRADDALKSFGTV